MAAQSQSAPSKRRQVSARALPGGDNATRFDLDFFNSIIAQDVNTVIWNKIGQSDIVHKRTSSILRRQITVIGEQVSILFSFWLLFVQCYSKYHLL